MKKSKNKDASVNKNKWKIAFTNDKHLTGHRKSRPVVIVADNGVNVKVSRITSLAGKDKKVQKGYVKPIGTYKNLSEPSGVDKFKFSNDKETGKKLDLSDKRIFRKVTNEKLRASDRRKIKKHLQK